MQHRELVTRNTPAWRIWNLQFPVLVPRSSMYTLEALRDDSVNVTGVREVDQARMNELHPARHTAAGLAMLMAEGYGIRLMDRFDCVQIYADIQDHFFTWEQQTNSSVPPEAFPPLEDLRMLEMLALEVYEEAQRMRPKEQDNASRIFDSFMRMNRRRNIIAADKAAAKRVQDGEGKLLAYDSVVDRLERYIKGE